VKVIKKAATKGIDSLRVKQDFALTFYGMNENLLELERSFLNSFFSELI